MNYRRHRTVVYRAESSGPGKWIFAFIVFVLAMTITWAEADGINVPLPAQDSTRVQNTNTQVTEPLEGTAPTNPPDDPGQPSPIPEPMTILLVSAGAGAAYLMRRKMMHR